VAEKSPQWGRSGSAVLRVLEELAVRSCHEVAAVSPAIGDHLRQRYGRPVAVIPPGVNAQPPVSPSEIRRWGLTDGSYVLYLGRLSSEKAPHLLVEAFRRLPGGLRLVVAGDSRHTAYKSRLAAMAAEDPRILLVGQAGGRVLEELLSNARLFVLPSLLEGLPLALLEAMNYGRACLVSDITENLYAMQGAGFTFRSDDAESLTERLRWCIGNPDACAAAGRQAQTLVRSRYTWDATADLYESLYRQCLVSSGGHAASLSHGPS
jgi:glycosyltransferase involved in cell wall biosynthesis